MHSSDGEDVVAGMQKVILLPSTATGVAFPIDVAAYSAAGVAAQGEAAAAQKQPEARVLVIAEPSRQQ
jgi:hypothetical protein